MIACGLDTNSALMDIINCGAYSIFQLDYTILAFFFIGIFALFAYKYRLDFDVTLFGAVGITYGMFLITQNSILLSFMAMLIIGLALRLVKGLYDIFIRG